MKERLYQRLWEILNGEDTTEAFQSLTAETRLAIREILIDTKKGLPAYWKRMERKGSHSALLHLKGVEEVDVQIVWDPPWTPARMTQRGRAETGIYAD